MKKMWKRRFRDRGPKYMHLHQWSFKQRGRKRRDIPDFAQIQHGKNRITERA
jgi:hypothetical protein